MTYAITIAEPGAEPVSVSLEWTTDRPKVEGWYIADAAGMEVHVYFEGEGFYCPGIHGKMEVQADRWLGPIPLAPGG